MASQQTDKETRMQLTKDEILNHVDGFGRYQKVVTFIFCLINFIFSYELLITFFSTLTPTWRCRENSTLCPWNETYSGDDYRRCNIPQYEWEYTKPDDFSLVTTFKLHCSKEWLVHLASSTYYIGWSVSSVIIGSIADNFGRKKVIIPSLIIILLIEFICPFTKNIYIFIGCRFVIGCFAQGTTPQGCILLSEITNNKWRALSTNLIHITSSIAWCILGLKAYHLQNWKYLSFACSVPYIFLIGFYTVIPESIEWLVVHGDQKKVMSVFHEISRWNRKILDPYITMVEAENTSYKKTNPFILFRTRIMTYRCFAHCLIWCFGGMGYYGLSFAANHFGGSIYRDFILLQVADVPAVPCAIIASTYLGRKRTVLVTYFTSGIVVMTIGGVSTKFQFARIALGMFGKFLLGIGYNTIILWSTETFPTRYRSIAFIYLSLSCKCGAIASPWIVQSLHHFDNRIPFIIMGVSLVVTCFCSVRLPETKELRMESFKEYTGEGIGIYQFTNVAGKNGTPDQNDKRNSSLQGKTEESRHKEASSHIVELHSKQGNDFGQGSNEKRNEMTQGDSKGTGHGTHGYNNDGYNNDGYNNDGFNDYGARRDNDKMNSFIDGINDEGRVVREGNNRGQECNDEVANMAGGGIEKRNDLVRRQSMVKNEDVRSHNEEKNVS